jgi:hypothetical protein
VADRCPFVEGKLAMKRPLGSEKNNRAIQVRLVDVLKIGTGTQ